MPGTTMTQEQSDAEFERIFNEITSEPKSDEPGVSEKNEKESGAGVPNEAEVVPPEAKEVPGDVPVDPANTPPTSNGEIDYKEAYEKEIQRTKSWEGRIKAANKRAEEEAQRAAELSQKLAETAKKTETPASPVSAATMDDPDLKEFFTTYPELIVPFEKLVRTKGAEVAEQVIQREMAKLLPKVEALETHFKEDTVKAHFSKVSQAHPGWEKLVEDGSVNRWIDSQPALMRNELNRVMSSGSTEEAIELLNLFKASSQQQQPNITTKRPTKKPEDILAVPATRANVPRDRGAPDTYDSAWEEATRKK